MLWARLFKFFYLLDYITRRSEKLGFQKKKKKKKKKENGFYRKNLNFKHHSQDFKCLPGQKTGGGATSIQEGASVGINTVHNDII